MSLKQVIVVRKDLRLNRGKLAAQVAHASLTAADRSDFKREWILEGQKKAVLRVENLEKLRELYEEAKERELPAILIRDAGFTQLPPDTITCLGIGPAPEGEIDEVTGKLKLL